MAWSQIMSRVICVGDPHFSNGNITEAKLLMDQLLGIVDSDCAVVMLGDLLHRHALIDLAPMCLMIELMSRVGQICPVYVLVGNHDIANNKISVADGADHALKCLQYMHGVTVVDKPHHIEMLGLKTVLIPYYPTGCMPHIDCELMFCHQEFKGCKMGQISSKSGDTCTGKKLVISGHIHDHQVLTHGSSTIIYAGTPYMTTFGECTDKMLLQLSRHDSELKLVHRHHDLHVHAIPLHIMPKITLRCSAQDFWSAVHEADAQAVTGAKVRIIVTGRRDEVAGIPSLDRHKIEVKIINEMRHEPVINHEHTRITLRELIMCNVDADEHEYLKLL